MERAARADRSGQHLPRDTCLNITEAVTSENVTHLKQMLRSTLVLFRSEFSKPGSALQMSD